MKNYFFKGGNFAEDRHGLCSIYPIVINIIIPLCLIKNVLSTHVILGVMNRDYKPKKNIIKGWDFNSITFTSHAIIVFYA